MAASAQIVTNTYALNPGVAIPDGNPTGLREVFNVSGLTSAVSSIQLNLDITGGFNGDLYAYLVSPSGGFAVLLNRVGLSGSNPFGYSTAGFNITLDAAGPNIHNYQSGSFQISGGQLTGTWAPDGRNISPTSSGGAFDAAATTGGFGSFVGSNPNGAWTLFMADLSSGGSAYLAGVTLTIMTVPEPSAWALLLAGGLLGAIKVTARRMTGRGRPL